MWRKWALTCDFQQCGILTCVDSEEPLQPPFNVRNSKWCSVSSLTIIEYSSNYQRLWSDCAYAQADLRLCWWHIPHCWKSHALSHIVILVGGEGRGLGASCFLVPLILIKCFHICPVTDEMSAVLPQGLWPSGNPDDWIIHVMAFKSTFFMSS